MPKDNPAAYQRIQLPFALKHPVLALGGQRKNTVCFAKGRSAYLSRVHPDLNILEDFLEFEKDLSYLLKKHPRLIAVDLHPEYQSSKITRELPFAAYPVKYVQHHHAHIVSCMLENGLSDQKVIGVALDGTGMGSSGALWGAEFLICDYRDYLRAAHLQEIPLLGGEKVIEQPWRAAVSWLNLVYQDGFWELNIPLLKKLSKRAWQRLKNTGLTDKHSMDSSSMGRLFDAAGSLILNKTHAEFEAQLAMELEILASGYHGTAGSYPFRISKNEEGYVLHPEPMFKRIIEDLLAQRKKEEIAYRFHLGVARMVRDTCSLLESKNRIRKIVLSGGVFQNKLLLYLSSKLLAQKKFQVFSHRHLSANDTGISLGQAVIAGL